MFAVREFRFLYAATALSLVGDYLARAAITLLVYQETDSVALSAASFAISYLPWILGGPLLATMAERYPYRRVMVACDLLRMVLIGAVALPGMPVAGMLALIFVAMLATPPTQAARSALLPLVLRRDQLVTGLAVNTATVQVAQVVGYPAGAALAALLDPRVALVVNAGTFAASALLITAGLRRRPAVVTADARRNLLRETADGFQLVFGAPVLRSIATLVFCLVLFAIVPEGLAAAWAREAGGVSPGVAQGLIMAAGPVGFVLGGLTINRFVREDRRHRLIRPFAVLAPLALVPSLLAPPAPVVAAMALVSGFAAAGIMPSLNGIFVLALPHGYRARAFGVMQGGMQLAQGGAVLVTGALAERFDLPLVVGWWSAAGVLLMAGIGMRWPRPDRFEAAIAAAERRSAPALAAEAASLAAAEPAAAGAAGPVLDAALDPARDTPPGTPAGTAPHTAEDDDADAGDGAGARPRGRVRGRVRGSAGF
nr:MFS transporter [Spirilliplanes yamanashiensis]